MKHGPLRLLTYRVSVQAVCLTCEAADVPVERASTAHAWAEQHALDNDGHTMTITTHSTAAYLAQPKRPRSTR